MCVKHIEMSYNLMRYTNKYFMIIIIIIIIIVSTCELFQICVVGHAEWWVLRSYSNYVPYYYYFFLIIIIILLYIYYYFS